ncbi:hypothetical protein BC940DRAFT_292294 [Gongronella butleri]|nr:hypothetical protein BC940DRAFT_292294 [Gongronella butleri]
MRCPGELRDPLIGLCMPLYRSGWCCIYPFKGWLSLSWSNDMVYSWCFFLVLPIWRAEDEWCIKGSSKGKQCKINTLKGNGKQALVSFIYEQRGERETSKDGQR